MRPRICLIGPLTNGGTATREQAEERLREAAWIGTELVRLGFSVSLPHWSIRHWDHALQIPHAAWMESSIAQLAVADCVYRMPGESLGVEQEETVIRERLINGDIDMFYSLNEAEQWMVRWRQKEDG